MNPLTGLMIQQGLSLGTGLLSYGAARRQYRQDLKNYKKGVSLIKEDLRESYADSLLRAMQELMAVRTTLEDETRERLRAQGTAITASGESGVMGASVDALLRDIEAQSARFSDRTRQQFSWDMAAMAREREQMARDARARIHSLARPARPNLLAHALSTGSEMMRNYNAYRRTIG